MTSPLIRLALAAGLALSVTPALAQTDLSNAQIVDGLKGLTDNAPGISAELLKQQAQQNMVKFPGDKIVPPPLVLSLDKLAQITVQIQFDFNSAMILPSSYRTLGSIADALHNPILQGYKFLVVGNTDGVGSREYNLKLSQERADAIVAALTTVFNVAPNRLQAVGLGKEALQDTKNPDAAVNRRVQIYNIGRVMP
ncbi:OmpA family protein [Roseixanthobacter liquoris]|uniref:OmpA family protein n=1 Tax=Roseixanthobacter liquoris TaxID=3119921 RepID=UPI003728D62C